MDFKILQMIAISGFLTALECTKFVFSRGSAPDPAGEAYSVSPDTLAGLRVPTSKGKGSGEEGKEKERKGKEGSGWERKRRERRGDEGTASFFTVIPGSAPNFYRATACNATHGVVMSMLSACPSVCLSNA